MLLKLLENLLWILLFAGIGLGLTLTLYFGIELFCNRKNKQINNSVNEDE